MSRCHGLAVLLAVGCAPPDDRPFGIGTTASTGTDGVESAGAAGAGAGEGESEGEGEDAAEYGPENDWPHALVSEVPADLEGTGRRQGDVMPNFTLIDQHGDQVELYQFYGNVVQLVLFAEWCGPCQAEAPDLEAASRTLADAGVVVVDVMMQDNASDAPDARALLRWASEYGVTHPLLAGPGTLGDSVQGGYPTLPILNRDMTIANLDNFPFSASRLASYAE